MPRYGHKFRAVRTERDGIKFDSKAEARRYDELVLARKNGTVVQFLVHAPRFLLPGGTSYTADFLVFWADTDGTGGSVTVEDVKGMRTPAYKRSKKQVEALYAPITITEV